MTIPPPPLRRVVTGLDPAGQSTILLDTPALPDAQNVAMLWNTGPTPVDNTGAADAALAGFDMDLMQAGGTFFFVYEHPPHAEGFWHTTHTIEYIVILSGQVVLQLDTGEVTLHAGDCVVDRGIRHRWQNRTAEPCRAAIVSLPARPLPAPPPPARAP